VKAAEAFEYSISLDREDRVPVSNLGHALLSLFHETKDEESYRKANDNFRKAVELDPEFAPAYYELGMACIQTGDLAAAIDCWEKALEISPEFDQVVYNLALAYLENGEKSKALVYLERYKRKNYDLISPDERHKLDAMIRRLKSL
jgi:tetratricopeptide (TPR) repeat protein